jgi:protein-S-isoprenylcysteine O-methyltransferase Ste14
MMFGAPLLLGSIWGLFIGVIALFDLIGRISGEEKMLIEALPGYSVHEEDALQISAIRLVMDAAGS